MRACSRIFSLGNLRHGVFAQLPPARIDELLTRFERDRSAKRGDVVIREGDEGDLLLRDRDRAAARSSAWSAA